MCWKEVGIAAGLGLLVGIAFIFRIRDWLTTKAVGLLLLGVGTVAVASLVSAFPFNVRYALPGLLGFLALAAALSSSPKTCSRLALCALVALSLWADAQWFYKPAYRKNDCRAVAQWLVRNEARVQSWTVVPDYLRVALQFYLQPHPAIASRCQLPKESQTTSFPPVPDALILGRRHHVLRPEELISAYRQSADPIQSIYDYAGFEIYVREEKNVATESKPDPLRLSTVAVH